MKTWMVYGAYGYTGRLIVAEAAKRGMRPILAGRNREKVEALAQTFGLESRVFALEQAAEVAEGLRDVGLVLHCAGPFSATSAPMLDACLATGAHYLDISGEISVFEAAWKRSQDATEADVVVCPGVGFDVVPTDCLAARLVRQLPSSTALALAFESLGGMSRGTAKTGVEGLKKGGCIRRDGALQQVPLAWKTRTIPFAHGERNAVTIPWGDVFTAWVSTGVPNIEVYMAMPRPTIKKLRRLRLLRPLLSLGLVQAFLKRRVDARRPGPGEEHRARSTTHLWGEARSADGRYVSATMTTPNGYDLTVSASLGIVQFLLETDVEGGFYTPSLLVGADFAESLPGVSLSMNEPGTNAAGQ